MENQGSFTPSRKSADSSLLIMIGIGVVLVIILALMLNYLNFFPLSENYPRAFGWLPHQTSGVATPKVKNQQSVDNSSFTPSLNPESQKGPLVKSATVVYTLQGKITKVAPNGSNYNLEITSFNGGQIYNAINIGGKGVLRGAKSGGEIAWDKLSPGDDVLVNVSASMDSSGKETTSVGQILVNNK